MKERRDDRSVLVDNEEPIAILDNAYDSNNGFEHPNLIENDLNYSPINFNSTLQTQSSQNDNVIISTAPQDRYLFTYIVFSLLGIATMTPWNFFITAEDYWMYKFRNTTNNNSHNADMDLTPMQKSFTSDLTLTASISGTIFLILHAIYGQKISLRLRMLGTLFIILALFLLTTAFVEENTDKWQETFFLITLLTVIVLNISSAVMCGALFGFAGLFPSTYMSSVVSGQALGGIFTALTFVAVLALGTDPQTTALIYFTIGTATIFLSIILYMLMSSREFFKYYLAGGDKYAIPCETPSHSQAVDVGVSLEPDIHNIFSKIFIHAVGINLVFASSLSVYPAVSVLMQSQDFGSGSAWSDVYYMPVTSYVLFNTGDYLGRVLAGTLNMPKNNVHTVFLMTILRLLYIPLILCSNTNLHYFLPTIVHTDAGFMLLISTFALSNGYLTNMFLMMAPRAVMQHEREIASSIMAAALSAGLVLGSLLSMAFVRLL